VRYHACLIIVAGARHSLPFAFLERAIGEVPTIVAYYQVFDHLFQLLSHFVAHYPEVRDFAISGQWEAPIIELIDSKIPAWIAHRSIDEAQFWSHICLSGVFRLLSHLRVSQTFIQKMIEDASLRHVLSSKTDMLPFVDFLRNAADTGAVLEVIVSFAKRSAIYVPYLQIGHLLFRVAQQAAFGYLKSFHYRVENRSVTAFDFAVLICHLIVVHGFVDLFFSSPEMWLMELLLDENPGARIATYYAVVALVRHESLFPLPPFPHSSLAPGGFDFAPWPEAPETIGAAQQLLGFLLANRNPVVDCIRRRGEQGNSACCYFQLMARLAVVANRSVRDEFVELATAVAAVSSPLSGNFRFLLDLLIQQGVELPGDLLNHIFSAFDPSPEGAIATLPLLRNFESHIKGITFSESVIHSFLVGIAFPSDPRILNEYSVVLTYLTHFAQTRPEYVVAFVNQWLEWCCKAFLTSVVVVLEAANAKLPLLQHLTSAVGQRHFFPITELVCRALAVASEPSEADALALVPLLNVPAIERSARDLIWNLLSANPPPFEDFAAVYTCKQNQVDLTRFLLLLGNPEVKNLLLEAAQTDIKAFALSFKYLKEIAEAEIIDLKCVGAIICLDLGEECELVIDYLNYVFDKTSEAKERVLRPLVEKLRMKVQFLTRLLDDGAEVMAADVNELLGCLSVIERIGECREWVAGDLEKLRDRMKSVTGLDELKAVLG
jgi:hypothetical protein